MHELDIGKTVDLNRARRERAQPLQVVSAELLPGPEGGSTGNWIEVRQIHQAPRCLVVIASNEGVPQLSRPLDDLIRTASITNNVSQIHHDVIGRRSRKASLERLKV